MEKKTKKESWWQSLIWGFSSASDPACPIVKSWKEIGAKFVTKTRPTFAGPRTAQVLIVIEECDGEKRAWEIEGNERKEIQPRYAEELLRIAFVEM